MKALLALEAIDSRVLTVPVRCGGREEKWEVRSFSSLCPAELAPGRKWDFSWPACGGRKEERVGT